MTTLRIEHAITDYQLWKKAFDGFAEARATGRRPQLRHPPAGRRPEVSDA